MTRKPDQPDPPTDSRKERGTAALTRARPPRHYRLWFYLALLIASGLAGLLVWQLIAGYSLRRDHVAERAALVQQHARELDTQAIQLLRTSGVLMGWAIASPLAGERFDEIESHIKVLVREESIMIVAVADASGTIRLATNHKLEGQTLERAFPRLPAEDSDLVVTHDDDGVVAIIPVVDAGREVGRAVIAYQHHREQSKLPARPSE